MFYRGYCTLATTLHLRADPCNLQLLNNAASSHWPIFPPTSVTADMEFTCMRRLAWKRLLLRGFSIRRGFGWLVTRPAKCFDIHCKYSFAPEFLQHFLQSVSRSIIKLSSTFYQFIPVKHEYTLEITLHERWRV